MVCVYERWLLVTSVLLFITDFSSVMNDTSVLLLASWIFIIAVAITLIAGYSIYRSVKRRFDEIYKAKKILPKRIIHGIVYIIFLVLVYEGVRIRVHGELAPLILFFAYLFLLFAGLFIFSDILFTIYKIIGGGKWSQ